MKATEMIECREPALQMQRLISIMKRLRAPHGCPWDAEQTHHSLISNMIEEAYEVVDTIQRNDWTQLREELGDVLLQVVFHAEIAQEAGRFNFNDVAAEVSEKLVRRHPHVFAQSAGKRGRKQPHTCMGQARGCLPCSRHGSSRKKPPK